jgi:hypothetical protein
MRCSPVILLALLGGCATTTQTVPQPSPTSIQVANVQLATLTYSDGSPLQPVDAWQIGDYSVRAACHAYLNSAAAQQTNLNLVGMGVGVIGAGASIYNPLAGVASSLVQTLINAYSSSGPVPTTADAIIIEGAMDAYEAAAVMAPPTSVASAVSYVDDLWFNCAAGGAAILELKAKMTAQIGSNMSQLPSAAASYRASMPMPSRRPTITVNGQ